MIKLILGLLALFIGLGALINYGPVVFGVLGLLIAADVYKLRTKLVSAVPVLSSTNPLLLGAIVAGVGIAGWFALRSPTTATIRLQARPQQPLPRWPWHQPRSRPS